VEKNAKALTEKLRANNYEPYIYKTTNAKNQKWYIVRTGDYENLDKALQAVSLLKKKENMPAIITRKGSLTAIKVNQENPAARKTGATTQTISGKFANPIDRLNKSAVSEIPHPYSLQLSSFRSQKSAHKELEYYKNIGLAPYIVKVDLGQKGTWRVIYLGHYKNPVEARRAMAKHKLPYAIVKKTPFSCQIGVYEYEEDLIDMVKRLEAQGYYPYVIKGPETKRRLLLGAFTTKAGAEVQNRALRDDGIQCEVVER
jgi:septal ring-binding cell division protein DamX